AAHLPIPADRFHRRVCLANRHTQRTGVDLRSDSLADAGRKDGPHVFFPLRDVETLVDAVTDTLEHVHVTHDIETAAVDKFGQLGEIIPRHVLRLALQEIVALEDAL